MTSAFYRCSHLCSHLTSRVCFHLCSHLCSYLLSHLLSALSLLSAYYRLKPRLGAQQLGQFLALVFGLVSILISSPTSASPLLSSLLPPLLSLLRFRLLLALDALTCCVSPSYTCPRPTGTQHSLPVTYLYYTLAHKSPTFGDFLRRLNASYMNHTFDSCCPRSSFFSRRETKL
jgi:hypothetical protein